MSYWVFGAVKLNSTLFPYQSVGLSPEIEKALMNSDARAGHSFTGVKTMGPVARLNTPALKSLLDITGLIGASLTAFEVFQIKHDATGVASGNVHRKWSMTGGALAQIENISTSDGYAMASAQIHAVDDGTNAVWTLTEGVALPTLQRVTDVWYQGPLYIDDDLYKVEQMTITPNAEVIKRYSNGQVGPGFVGLRPATPTITVRAADGALHGLAGAGGVNTGPVTIFLRKGAEGSTLRVADATETHISIVVPSVYLTGDGVDGQPRQDIGFGVTMDVRDDGTNAIWTLDTTAAIAEPA